MTGAFAVRPMALRRGRAFNLGLALGLVLPLGLLVAFSLVPRDRSPDVPREVAEQRDALAAFEKALQPVVDAGAAVVVYGMRPGIVDIYEGNFPDATIVTMSEGWVASMRDARDRFAGIDVPGFLSEAARLYRQSFDEYVATAEGLVAAARAEGEERGSLVSEAAAHGERADDLYEAAQAEVERQRVRLGVPSPSG